MTTASTAVSLAALLVVAALLAGGCRAPPSGTGSLAETLAPIRAAHALPALAALVWRDGHVVAEGAVGVRGRDDDTPVALDDRWHVGSNTKAMTATLAAVLVDDGVMRWDTTVAEAFPDASVHTTYAATTLADLLGHRGGAPAQLDEPLRSTLSRGGTSAERRRAFARALLLRPSATPRGTFAYSNAGYVVAGAMLEAATGTDWEGLMRERVFAPLDMTACGFGPPPRVRGHTADGDVVANGRLADNPAALGPAGTVHCSLQDWARFAALHLAGARGDITVIVKPPSWRRLHTAGAADYALGLAVLERAWGGTVMTHSGSNTYFTATIWLAPEKNVALLVATNRGGDDARRGLDQAVARLVDAHVRP